MELSMLTANYLEKCGVFIALNLDTGLNEIQRIDEPEEYAIDMGLPFVPKSLKNDTEALEVVHNISQITLDDETITSDMRGIIIEECVDLLATI